MKINRVIIAIVLFVSPLLASAQMQFDKFEEIEGVSSVVVNKKLFTLMGKIGEESDEEYLDLIQNLDNLRVFATENSEVAEEMNAEVRKYLSSSNLEELMRAKDGNSNVVIYFKEGQSEDFVKELFMFVKDGSDDGKMETIIVSLTGNIDLNKISKLTKGMNIPGGEHLEKAKEKK